MCVDQLDVFRSLKLCSLLLWNFIVNPKNFGQIRRGCMNNEIEILNWFSDLDDIDDKWNY